MQKLQGKTVLITGGNSGIGYATAELFLLEGARVLITGRNALSVQEAVQKLGNGTIGIVSEATNMEDINNLTAVLKGHNIESIDVLFYNAGIAKFIPVSDISEAIFDDIMNTNFKGAFFTVQQLMPLINDGGSIIFTGTIGSHITMWGNSIYGASKAALNQLSKTIAVEYAGRKIRSNIVSPGPTNTPIFSKLGMSDEQLSLMAGGTIQKIPLARFGESYEVAKAVLFLASDDGSYVTGSELTVDGGTSILW